MKKMPAKQIYLLSVIILFITFILLKKTDNKINIISFICISVVTLFCYNTFICYILTFLAIPITLSILTVINFFIMLFFVTIMCKKKQIQKYSFEKIDIIYILMLMIVVLIIAYINFGIPLNVKYETSDPSVHYLTSMMFAKSDALLAGTDGDIVYGSFNTRKTVSYVNSGLLMKCFCKDLKPMECYNLFVIFGLLTLQGRKASINSIISKIKSYISSLKSNPVFNNSFLSFNFL